MSYGRFQISLFAVLLLAAMCARAQNPPQPPNCSSASIGFSLLLHWMPDLKGCSSPEIEKTLRGLHLTPRQVLRASSAPANQIVDQNPDPYTKLRAETPIVLYISEGATTPPASGDVVPEIPETAPTPKPSADLLVRNALSTAAPFHAGDRVEFTLFVQNNGPSRATGVRLLLTQENLSLVLPQCTEPACAMPDLEPGMNLTEHVTAEIVAQGPFWLTGVVSAREDDPHGKNNARRAGQIAEPAAPPPPPQPSTSALPQSPVSTPAQPSTSIVAQASTSAVAQASTTSPAHASTPPPPSPQPPPPPPWPWPPSPIAIGAAIALGLLGAGGAFHLTRKAWWRKRIHARVQLDVTDHSESVGALHLTQPPIGVQVSVLPGRSAIERLPIEHEETSHD